MSEPITKLNLLMETEPVDLEKEARRQRWRIAREREEALREVYCRGIDADAVAARLEVAITIGNYDALNELSWEEFSVLCRSKYVTRILVPPSKSYRSPHFMGHVLGRPPGSPAWIKTNG